MRRPLQRALTLFALLSGLGCRSEPPPLHAGDELFGVLQEAVLAVEVRGHGERFALERSSPDAPFTLTVQKHGGPLERCSPAPEAGEVFAALRSIVAQRVDTGSQADALRERVAGNGWTELVIQDVIPNEEPFRLRLAPDPRDPSQLLAVRLDDTRAFAVSRQLLAIRELRCPAP